MASRKIEDTHISLLDKLLSESGLECTRAAPESLEEESLSGDSEEHEPEEEAEPVKEEATVEEETPENIETVEEELPYIFPTPSLRKVLPERIRKIEEQNRIHVLPEEFKTEIDPAAIPKISLTAQQKYIDILADLVGCTEYKSSLAEFWFLDTMANLLRRAQEDNLDRQTQAVLILWFCEWIKEVQHFDAADRSRMMKRFKDNMLSAAVFVAIDGTLPTPKQAGVYYKTPDDVIVIPLRKMSASPRKSDLVAVKASASSTPAKSGLGSPAKPLPEVTFEGKTYECCLRDLTKIIHYIFDLFSTDYQYSLVRSVFTFTPEYQLIDAPYQIQTPKRLYAPLKAAKKEKTPRKDKSGKSGKAKKVEDPPAYLALMELKAKEELELDENEALELEEWNRKSHILPLNFAIDDTFLDKYWPPPPPELEPPTVVETKGKKGKK